MKLREINKIIQKAPLMSIKVLREKKLIIAAMEKEAIGFMDDAIALKIEPTLAIYSSSTLYIKEIFIDKFKNAKPIPNKNMIMLNAGRRIKSDFINVRKYNEK